MNKYVISCEGKVDILMLKKTHPYKQISTLNPKTCMYVLKEIINKKPILKN